MLTVLETKGVTPQTTFAWLEITPSCQLHCTHCYRESMPGLGHGKLGFDQWKQAIASLQAQGTRYVQFIGGEPTIHPHFCELLEYAASLDLHIEVYTNLVSITSRMWEQFTQHQVRIATSFYTDNPAIHDEITGVTGSYHKTLANIKKVLDRGLKLRVGMVKMRDDQDIESAKAMLTDLGVKKIGVDRARGVGRGTQLLQEDPISALCGACTKGKAVITANGEVYNCIMSRSFVLGNVLQEDIATILNGTTMQATTAMLNTAFAARPDWHDCGPDDQDCDPECDPKDWPDCNPDCCPATVADCEPSEDE
ncbi:MAG: radical SAM protein [Ktedonobacteraceae bacterium]|nr:radical SAM protein [Ktedonobacteraceae bacterium]